MANGGELTVKVLVINEDELRRIIREEVQKARTPAVYPPPVVYPHRPHDPYRYPTIYCGTSTSDNTKDYRVTI